MIKSFQVTRSIELLVTGIFCILIHSCSNGGLSRNDAASIILNDQSFPRPIYASIRIGRVSEGNVGIFGPTWNEYLKTWTQLESLGYIKLKRLGKVYSGGLISLPWETVQVTLTDKGRSIFTELFNDFWKAEICKKVFLEVTGISFDKDKVTAIGNTHGSMTIFHLYLTRYYHLNSSRTFSKNRQMILAGC
jgi:hypothetical protein